MTLMRMKRRPTGAARQQLIEGRENLKRVRAYLATHPGAKQSDIAEALGLSVMAVNRHVKAIRAEWSEQ